MLKLGLLFISVTSIELILLMQFSRFVGVLPTIALILFTGFLGAHLTRLQGLQTLRDIQESLAMGKMPASEIVDGVCILIAGAFLLTPGILTDLSGFLLLTPAFRALLKKYLVHRFKRWLSQHAQVFVATSASPHPFDDDEHIIDMDGDIIDQ